MEVQFDPASLVLVNIILATMMFGVSLSLRADDFRRILTAPVAPVAGLVAQFLLLPGLTCLGTWAFGVDPELALGMILVASCPGGTFSNVMTWLARANVAISVSMTAVSSVAATVMTPLNFALYGYLNPDTRGLLESIAIEPSSILTLVVLVLAVPLALGMWVAGRSPRFAAAAEKPFRIAALIALLGFVAIAFGNNFDVFIGEFGTFFWLVVAHNLLALALGNGVGRAMRLELADRRAVTLEVGIQNSGLGLVILFTFFPEFSGMILIAAFWGVWHLVSGLTLALVWSRSAGRAASAEVVP
ncbi:MAG TPA: bile acid:sodium symporter family protein [Jiangellaceae bacterium]